LRTTKSIICAFVICLALFSNGMTEEFINISNVTITDVTDVHFSVVWAVNIPGACDIKIYSDKNASLDITDQFTTVSESALHPPAESFGVMKVNVKGAKPDTTYYFKPITKAKTDSSKIKISDEVYEVKTEKFTSVMNNNTIVQSIRINNEDKKAFGSLLIAVVPEASYPLTAWVGDGYPGSFAGVDLSNLYKAKSRKSYDIDSGTEITLWGFGAISGYSKTNVIIDENYQTQLVDTMAVLNPMTVFEPYSMDNQEDLP